MARSNQQTHSLQLPDSMAINNVQDDHDILPLPWRLSNESASSSSSSPNPYSIYDHYSPLQSLQNTNSILYEQLLAMIQEPFDRLSLSGSNRPAGSIYNYRNTSFPGFLQPPGRSGYPDLSPSSSNFNNRWAFNDLPMIRPSAFSGIQSHSQQRRYNNRSFGQPTCECFSRQDSNLQLQWWQQLSVENLRGRVASISRDERLSERLANSLSRVDLIIGSELFTLIFSEVMEQLHELSVHRYANHVVQKLVEVCNQEQLTRLLRSLVRGADISFQEICMNCNGSRALQKIVQGLETREQKSILISSVNPIALSLIQNPSGRHIIEQCLKPKFSYEETKYIVKQIVDNCVKIATDKSGCCVLQHCIDYAPFEVKHRMVCELSVFALSLSQHHFGNYVVQYIIEHVPGFTGKIVAGLEGNFVTLSMNKYGSNVIEKCLGAGEEHSTRIISELMQHQGFLQLIQDDYGNYVAQKALDVSKGYVHKSLVNFIQYHYRDLHSHPYGKKVLAVARRKHRVPW